MGDRHHGASATRKKASKVLTRRYRLLHEVGGSRSISHDHRSKGTKICMEKYCMQVQDPQTIISDNGRQFDSQGFRSFCSSLGIKNKYSSLGHPQANGQTEVTDRTLLKIIKTRLVGAKGAWPEELPSVLWA